MPVSGFRLILTVICLLTRTGTTMIRRLTGLAMLLIILIPPAIAVLGWTTISGFAGDVQEAAEIRIGAINERLENVNERLATVQTAAAAISQSINGLISDVNTIAATISNALNFNLVIPLPDLPDVRITIPVINVSVRIPLPDLGNLNLEIPGLRQVAGFFEDIFDYLAEFAEVLSDLAEIQTVATELGAAAGEAVELVDDIRTVAADWSGTLIPLAGLCLGWFVLVWVVVTLRWLMEGWRMLTGK